MPLQDTPTTSARHFLARMGIGIAITLGSLVGCNDTATEPTPPASPPSPTIIAGPETTTSPPAKTPTPPADPPQTPPVLHSPAETVARELLAHLTASRFSTAAKAFSPEVLKALPVDKLKATWETILAQAGGYQSVAATAQETTIQANQVVDLLCTFEKAQLVFRVSMNSDGQVAGIFFLPAPKPEPTPAPPTTSQAQHGADVVLNVPDATLHGTIDWPSGDGPFPAMLVISGSGPNDRDGNQATLKSDYMKKLGTALASHGIAALRFDKRGSGRSRFTQGKENDFRFNSLVTDARGWLDLMRKHKNISRVGIIGHSQGSLVALLTAQATPVAAVVSIAGAGRSIDKVMEIQLTERLATMPETRDQSLAIIKQLAAGQTVATVPPPLVTLFRPSVQPFLISWMKHDPQTIIARSTTPTLIVQGTRDIQVSVGDARTLQTAQPSAALVLIEDMNHVLRHITTDAEQLPSYSNPALPLAPELVPALLGFLEQELATRPPQ